MSESRGRPLEAAPFAVVIGDIDLVRPLGLAGIPVAVMASPGDPARYSRFTREILDWANPWDEPDGVVESLLRFAGRQRQPPVLFYEGDPDLLIVSRHRARLGEAYRLLVPDVELVEDLVDKARFQKLASRLSLPVPRALHLRPVDEAVPTGLEIPFPVILKPLTRRGESWRPIAGGVKAQQVDSAAALQALWPRLAAAGLEVLVQQLIPGPESNIESYHVYVDAQGSVAGEFTGRKVRTFPARHGYSSALTISDAEDVAVLGRELVGRIGLRGVAKFDFKRAADGSLFLLEINPRFNIWHHPGALAGVNLPALVYADLLGLERQPANVARPGVNWCVPWHDRAAAREAGMSLTQWIPWMLTCEAKRAFAWDDPLPLVRGALFKVAHGARRWLVAAT